MQKTVLIKVLIPELDRVKSLRYFALPSSETQLHQRRTSNDGVPNSFPLDKLQFCNKYFS